MKDDDAMTIARAAKASGLPVKTLRYYDEIDLLRPKHRSASGYRLYSASDVRKLAFIQRARSFGFRIEACRDLLSLQQSGRRDRNEVRQIAEVHLEEIEAKLAALRGLKRQLEGLVDECRAGHGPDCPILTELEIGEAQDQD